MSRRRLRRRAENVQRHPPPSMTATPLVVVRETTRVERLAYTRTQAADALGISRSSFDRRVLPFVETVEMPLGHEADSGRRAGTSPRRAEARGAKAIAANHDRSPAGSGARTRPSHPRRARRRQEPSPDRPRPQRQRNNDRARRRPVVAVDHPRRPRSPALTQPCEPRCARAACNLRLAEESARFRYRPSHRGVRGDQGDGAVSGGGGGSRAEADLVAGLVGTPVPRPVRLARRTRPRVLIKPIQMPPRGSGAAARAHGVPPPVPARRTETADLQACSNPTRPIRRCAGTPITIRDRGG
jgi:hypothetical protein